MKKRWFRRLLERRILVILLLLGQLVFLIGLIQSSSQTYRVINWILTAVSIGVALYIISKKDKGAYKLTWIMLILIFPLFGGLLVLLAEPLCIKPYESQEARRYPKLYALLVPMLYCDALTDAMTKGLGQQTACVRYNILTSAMDVVFLYLLLPKYGMDGYFASFFITHLVNFLLSFRRLLKISGVSIPFYIPALTLAAAMAAVAGASRIGGSVGQCIAYCALLGSLLYLCRIIGKEDFFWMKGLLTVKK